MIGQVQPAPEPAKPPSTPAADVPATGPARVDDAPREIGGREGPDPTRYGDWEKNGRCIDF
ncbi:Protein of unknown function [Aquimonas voraii]|uniref:DUF1674 domain-containing protein n=1 Tax=Aquimonas voraii TaxID=265719 RepID=A0A1G6SC52_9GAMM|nr:Protein of unknown function [Aquimonas voraii]